MNDLISRQEALNMPFSNGINEDGALYVPWREVKDNLEKLPSAQPEIIRCEDCKYREEDEDEHGIVDRWCRIWAETCTDDGYCNYAERV